MNLDTYNRFKELRQHYYIAGRNLMVNQLFDMAGINFGYAIELSLKFLLAFNGHPQNELMKHHVKRYYEKVLKQGYVVPLNVSEDFLIFMDERLNARYPKMIADHLASYESDARAYVFSIDMLHCYDDFILRLDDAVVIASSDPRTSIGFRCCRELTSIQGRIFFHCNDHAFSRIPRYRALLAENRDDNDNYGTLDTILAEPNQLWNFPGMMSYRPWGPKMQWSPASEFVSPKFNDKKLMIKAAKWVANNSAIDMYISSSQVILPPGTYQYGLGEITTASNTEASDTK